MQSSTLDNLNTNSAEALEGQRHFNSQRWQYWLVAIIAFCWSLFQLYTVIAPDPFNSTQVRSIHLSFALLLAFLIYPFLHRWSKFSISWYDFLFAVIASIGAFYIFWEFKSLALRPGDYLQRDIIIAMITTFFLLEASRRVLGPALAIVAIVFLVYDHFGPYMPEMIAHRGASLNKLAGHMFLTTEGIFGVPLGVSASFVFLFVLFGSLLEKAGAGQYFINLSYAVLGRFRGGPAKASVVASGLTGIISGSSTANTVTTGTFTIPLMKHVGFPAHKAAAVEVAASTNGQLMPPIMGAAAFIIAEYLGISYANVIYAAFIPAFVSYFALFYVVHLEACKLGIKGEDPSLLPPKLKTFLSGLHYLIPIFFLIYTLVWLQQSAISAAFNAIMFIMLIMVVQRPITALMTKQSLNTATFTQGFVDIFNGMVSGARNMVPIALATAVAGIVVGSVTLTGIGQVLIEVIEQLANGNIMLILIFTAFISLILGMGLPTTANYIIMASLTAPVILSLSMDTGYLVPAIAAHLFVFYFGILADDTPPVGIAAYAAAGIARANAIKTGIQGFTYDMRTAILPFVFFFNSEILLIRAIDEYDPSNASGWVWITNPFEVGLIFLMTTLGMFAFVSFLQSYFYIRTTWYERLLFIPAMLVLFLPNEVARLAALPHPYLSYAIGVGLFGMIFMLQKWRDMPRATA
ncbi:TRAP transporter permease [Candidatus Albibeggiatoa sp. nov. NOAA]|uniref:TRAP transporter permease n=1 Tax=Candidatus Albibeggiatoa sp. nov. NOAA TaxID=3162724 RepID=UPI0032FC4470|nr:TRAP transporter permease [Thiotrichaceae bacterium]